MLGLPHRHLLVLAAMGLVLPAIASAQPMGSPVTPTVDNPNRFAVSGVPTARRFFQLAASRRVDIALIGDSNARLGAASSGHEDWMCRAYAARFGMYATRVDGVGATGFLTQGESAWACSPFTYGGSSPVLDQSTFAPGPFPYGYVYLGAGTQASAFYNCGVALAPDSPIGIESPLRFHITCFDPAAEAVGAVNLCAREAWPGNIYHNYAALPEITFQSALDSYFDASMDVPAGPRASAGIMFCLTNAADQRGAVGPFGATWQRVERPSRTTGVSYSPLWEEGGRSARYTLLTMQTLNVHDPIIEWFRQVTRLQNAAPTLLVHIMHGGNDAFDFNPSLGPIGGMSSSTGPGHEDNIRGIMAKLRGWWIEAGNDPANLFFQLGPYHPRPGDDHDAQLEFEQAWRNIVASDPQVFSVAGNMMSTPEEFLSRGFRINADDSYHLSYLGYQTWATAMIRAIDGAICPPDFDESGAATVNDIFAFLNAWFNADRRADFNYSGTVEVQDIFDYLSAWFSGC